MIIQKKKGSLWLPLLSLEVPVCVFGRDGLTDDVRRSGSGEEVVVFAVGAECRQDRRVHLRDLCWEQRVEAKVPQRFVVILSKTHLKAVYDDAPIMFRRSSVATSD